MIRTRKGGCRPRVPVRADRVQIDGEEVKTRRFALQRAMPDVAGPQHRPMVDVAADVGPDELVLLF